MAASFSRRSAIRALSSAAGRGVEAESFMAASGAGGRPDDGFGARHQRRLPSHRGVLKRTMRQYRKTYDPMNRRRKTASTWVLFHQSTPGMMESRQSSQR